MTSLMKNTGGVYGRTYRPGGGAGVRLSDTSVPGSRMGPRTGYVTGKTVMTPANRNPRFGYYGAGGSQSWRYGAAGAVFGLTQLAEAGKGLMRDIGSASATGLALFNWPWEWYPGQWGQTGRVFENLVPGGWIRCGGGPTDACYATWGASHVGYDTLTSCLAYGTCPSGQVMPGPVGVIGAAPFSGARRSLAVFITNYAFGGNPAVWQGTLTRQWRRLAGDAAKPYPPLWRYAQPQPMWIPYPDPALHPGVKYNQAPNPEPWLDVDGRVRAKPRNRPALSIPFPRPRGGKAPTKYPKPWDDPGHDDKPDRKPTRKGGGKGDNGAPLFPTPLLAAIKAMRALTELIDAVGALFDALPLWRQAAAEKKYGGDWIGHLFGVAANWDAYGNPETFDRAVGNLLTEHAKDKVIGTLMGSQWRTGVRSFDGSYGSTAWTDASISGAFGHDYQSPGTVHRNY